MNLYPYLNFDGKAEEAMKFYQSVLGGEFEGGISYFGEIPGMELPEEEKTRVMHASLKISDSVKIMASDTSPSMGHRWIKGNHNYISINADSKDEGQRIFDQLSAGGKWKWSSKRPFGAPISAASKTNLGSVGW